MTAPAEGALRILKLEPVDFCCGEVLAESQIWVLAEDRTGKRLSRRIPATRPRSWAFSQAVSAAGRICTSESKHAAGAEAPAAWALY